MTERTRRATEAVETHTEFWEQSRSSTVKGQIEEDLLDVTKTPGDPRYGGEKHFYGAYGGTFEGWMKHIVGHAQTYTATTELWREVLLTHEMLAEEGLDWVPLKEHHLPANTGFFIAPYGIEVPKGRCWSDHGIVEPVGARRTVWRNGRMYEASRIVDRGGGDRWYIDGFVWEVTDTIARDGVAGSPTRGIALFPLTRWRNRSDDRPFRLVSRATPDATMPELVASDFTAWRFDDLGETEWDRMQYDRDTMYKLGEITDEELMDEMIEQVHEFRLWLRTLAWSMFRWMMEEIQLHERPERATERRAKKRPLFESPNAQDGDLVIFDLRKETQAAIEKHEATGEPRWWRSRWIVRKHKARRRYSIRDEHGKPVGPRTGPDARLGVTYEYRWVEIQPFEKGPDSAPLVFKENVGVLSR